MDPLSSITNAPTRARTTKKIVMALTKANRVAWQKTSQLNSPRTKKQFFNIW